MKLCALKSMVSSSSSYSMSKFLNLRMAAIIGLVVTSALLVSVCMAVDPASGLDGIFRPTSTEETPKDWNGKSEELAKARNRLLFPFGILFEAGESSRVLSELCAHGNLNLCGKASLPNDNIHEVLVTLASYPASDGHKRPYLHGTMVPHGLVFGDWNQIVRGFDTKSKTLHVWVVPEFTEYDPQNHILHIFDPAKRSYGPAIPPTFEYEVPLQTNKGSTKIQVWNSVKKISEDAGELHWQAVSEEEAKRISARFRDVAKTQQQKNEP